MKLAEYESMLNDGVKIDGLQYCLDCLQEECAELIVSISHRRRKRKDKKELIREMADVQIMLDMCKMGLKNHVGFEKEIISKAKELNDKIRFKGKSGEEDWDQVK